MTPTPAKVVADKWGEEVLGRGFQIIPDLLLRMQARLVDGGISSPEMVVLLNILMHWWTRDSVAFPRPAELAKRIGVDRRSVDRALAGLVKNGLLHKEKLGNRAMYDPNPLAEKLRKLLAEEKNWAGRENVQPKDESQVL